MSRKTIYLAAPYRGTPEQIQARMLVVAAFARWTRCQGHFVVSPLFQHWTFDPAHEEVGDGQYWLDLSESMLRDVARKPDDAELWVLLLPGWEQSTGLAKEIEVSDEVGIRMRYFPAPETIDDLSQMNWAEVSLQRLVASAV